MTTIYGVAKAAGVTAATVLYLLSGTGSVSNVTHERVVKHAQELDYRPNQIASKSSPIFMCTINNPTSYNTLDQLPLFLPCPYNVVDI